MFKKAKPFFMIVETPLHPGTGTDLGVVDLPIQRERHTGFPKIESSGLKGGIREAFENDDTFIEVGKGKVKKSDEELIAHIFGPEEGDLHAAALGFTDARLLLFPVKSMKSIFAWVTCPKVLNRFINDLNIAGIKGVPELPDENTVPYKCKLLFLDNEHNPNNSKIILEEYTFDVKKDEDENKKCSKFALWLSNNIFPNDDVFKYWREKLQNDLVVLSDDDFKDFVTHSTEIITRIKIDNETGTVQKGALFTEEYLPSETILYSLALTSPFFVEKKKKKIMNEEELVMEYFVKGLPSVIQLGGNATIGKGLVRTKVI